MNGTATSARRLNRVWLGLCALLLTVYSGTAWLAVRGKSPTYDEPYHAVSAWVQLHRHDYRIDNEDPPLWQYWAALASGRAALTADFAGPSWQLIPRSVGEQWTWCHQTLYRTPGNDAAALVARSRGMMLVWAVALGLLVARWSWQIGGGVAAVVATTLFALDPNFLAHGALMKNDVAFALGMTSLAWSLWRAGQRLTGRTLAGVAVWSAVMLTVKFSGVIAAAVVPTVLLVRALMPTPWPVMGRVLATRVLRALAAVGVTAVAAAVCYAGIWTVYGFRYAPTPDTGVTLNLDELAARATSNAAAVQATNGAPPQPAPTTPPAVRAAQFAAQHALLPQAYIAGFLFTYANNLFRPAFLCGHVSMTGWWWYFPLAVAVKTPIASLLAGGIAIAVLVAARRGANAAHLWTASALAVPLVLFLGSAMNANVNLGVRHVLPIYPLAFTGIGAVASMAIRRWPRPTRRVLLVLGLGLACESAAAFPNYIPFFNLAGRVAGGGIALLGDSNLDWGQDLPLLAQWQRANPDQPLYLSYFGSADPAAYGLRYTSLPGGYRYDARHRLPDAFQPCVLAISATQLQGVWLEDERLRAFYATFATRKPLAILGGSIYLFDYDPTQMIRPRQ